MRRHRWGRFALVLGMSLILLGSAMFAPIPTVDRTEDTTSTAGDVETTSPVLTQEADAFACGGGCIAAGVGIAVSAGVAGTVIGAGYFEADTGSQSGAYFSVQSLKDRIQTDYNNLNSSYEETRTMAYRVAETSFAEAMANGSSKVEAQQAADDAVTKYIADTLNDEFVRRHNAYATAISQIHNTSGVTVGDIYSSDFKGLRTTNVTVFSSSSESRTFELKLVDHKNTQGPAGWYTGGAGGDWDASFSSSDYNTVTFDSKNSDFTNLRQKYENLRGEVVTEIGTFSSSVNESQYENISADDVVSPVNQALEWGQSYNDTGSSGYASAVASSLGYGINGTGTLYAVEMEPGSGNWYNGTVYADEDTIPNGTITTGKIYNGTSTTAFVATDSGTTTLDQDWKVYEITTKDGEELNETKLSTWSRTKLNASAPLETLNEWQELQDTVGSGTTDGLGAGLIGGAGAIIALLGGGYLLMGRNGGGGGRGRGRGQRSRGRDR